MSAHEQAADLLDRAADYIERHGWHQGGSGHGPNGAACAVVACSNAAKELGLRDSAWLNATDVISDRLSPIREFRSLQSWNDNPERTKQEVLDALRLAAKSERRLADRIDR